MKDETTCPLCGRQNLCSVAASVGTRPCWCSSVEIPASVLLAAAGRSCVCRECINGAHTKGLMETGKSTAPARQEPL